MTRSPHWPCKRGVIIHRCVHTDPGHQTGRSTRSSHSSRGGVGWGGMGAGEKGHTGSTATQRSQARSPRMEPPDVGSPSPWESSQLFSILLGTRQGSRLKWQGAGSGEDRQPSWLWGRFLLPEPVRGLPPHRWGRGGKVTPTPGLVST